MTVYIDLNRNTGVVGPPLLTDQDAVLNSILNILTTVKGERVFRPNFGSILEDVLHDPVDSNTAVKIRIALVNALERDEPRVKVIQRLTKVDVDLSLPGYRVTLVVAINGLPVTKDYTLYLRALYGDR